MQIMKSPFIHFKKGYRFSIIEFNAIIVIINIKSKSQLCSQVQQSKMFVFMTGSFWGESWVNNFGQVVSDLHLCHLHLHMALPHHPMPFVCVFWWCNAWEIIFILCKQWDKSRKHISHASQIKTKTKGMGWWGSAQCLLRICNSSSRHHWPWHCAFRYFNTLCMYLLPHESSGREPLFFLY